MSSSCKSVRPTPVHRADRPKTLPATPLPVLPTYNHWRRHLQALLHWMHTGLDAPRTNIAQVTVVPTLPPEHDHVPIPARHTDEVDIIDERPMIPYDPL
jgi:hypothetical protein